MSRKDIGKVALVLLIIGLTLGLTAGASVAAKKYLSLGTGNPAGTFYFIGAGFASIFLTFATF